MKKPSETLRIKFATWIVSLAVLVALCFSIGEGLRLTPFPVATLTIDEASDPQFAVKASQGTSLYKYGPLDVPQKQKRNKRSILEFASAPSEIVRKLPNCLYACRDQQSPNIVSDLFASRLAGRDPPSAA